MKFHAVDSKFKLVNGNGKPFAILKVVEVETEPDPYFPEYKVRVAGGCNGCYYYRRFSYFQGGCIKTRFECSIRNSNTMCWCEDREDGKAVKYVPVKSL